MHRLNGVYLLPNSLWPKPKDRAGWLSMIMPLFSSPVVGKFVELIVLTPWAKIQRNGRIRTSSYAIVGLQERNFEVSETILMSYFCSFTYLREWWQVFAQEPGVALWRLVGVKGVLPFWSLYMRLTCWRLLLYKFLEVFLFDWDRTEIISLSFLWNTECMCTLRNGTSKIKFIYNSK